MQTTTSNATSSLPPIENLEEVQRLKIDEEIQQLQNRIQTLRSARNQLAPISRILVTEILTSIFLLARDTSDSPRGYMTLVVSWVCRDWREMALGYPVLWNDIESTNMEWVRESIVRSGCTSLAVTIDRQNQSANMTLPFLLQYLPRMRSFAIQDVDNQALPSGKRYTCSQDWNTPAPLLEELSLTQVNLSEAMFSGGVPRLQKLTLSYCTPGWKDNLLSTSLVSFSLHFPPKKVFVSSMVKILMEMPSLQDLSLSRSMCEDPSTTILEPRDPPHLHSLRTLAIATEECTTIAIFLHRVMVPSRARVSFKGYSEDNLEHADAIKALQDCRIDPSSRWELTHLEVYWHDNHCIWITETNRLGEFTVVLVQLPAWLGDGIVCDVVQILDLSHLKSLECRGNLPDVSYSSWSAIFGHLSKLHTLIFRDGCVPYFLQHLEAEATYLNPSSPSEPGPSSSSSEPRTQNQLMVDQNGGKIPTFMALRKLAVQGLLANDEDDEYTRLQKALAARKPWVTRLSELVLIDSMEVSSELLDLFVDGVEKVVWEPPPMQVKAEGDMILGDIVD